MREGDQIVTAQPAQDPPSPTRLSGLIRRFETYGRKNGAGIAGSMLLHGLIVLMLIFHWKTVLPEQPAIQRILPVDLVALSEGPAARPAQQRAAGVRSTTPHIVRRALVAVHTPSGVAPSKTAPPPDDLEIQLKALSKLRLPNSDPRLAGDAGTADLPESGEDALSGGHGAYSSRDIIRAQNSQALESGHGQARQPQFRYPDPRPAQARRHRSRSRYRGQAALRHGLRLPLDRTQRAQRHIVILAAHLAVRLGRGKSGRDIEAQSERHVAVMRAAATVDDARAAFHGRFRATRNPARLE